jgi:hypothetical protein
MAAVSSGAARPFPIQAPREPVLRLRLKGGTGNVVPGSFERSAMGACRQEAMPQYRNQGTLRAVTSVLLVLTRG